MGGLVEEMLGLVVEALQQNDGELARQGCEMDRQVDSLEKEIDEHCLRILALHQPAAEELRFVAMSMKLVTDLERMGDLVCNIGERVISLSEGEQPRIAMMRDVTMRLQTVAWPERLDEPEEEVVSEPVEVLDADVPVDDVASDPSSPAEQGTPTTIDEDGRLGRWRP